MASKFSIKSKREVFTVEDSMLPWLESNSSTEKESLELDDNGNCYPDISRSFNLLELAGCKHVALGLSQPLSENKKIHNIKINLLEIAPDADIHIISASNIFLEIKDATSNAHYNADVFIGSLKVNLPAGFGHTSSIILNEQADYREDIIETNITTYQERFTIKQMWLKEMDKLMLTGSIQKSAVSWGSEDSLQEHNEGDLEIKTTTALVKFNSPFIHSELMASKLEANGGKDICNLNATINIAKGEKVYFAQKDVEENIALFYGNDDNNDAVIDCTEISLIGTIVRNSGCSFDDLDYTSFV